MLLKILKPLSFIPALVLMYIIFSFSAQDGEDSSQLSYQVSYEIVEIGNKVLDAGLQPSEISSLATRFHPVVRKLAHMSEYFALAMAMAFPLYVYGLRGILLMLVAGGFCVAFACGDEYHQSYVSGRSPSKRDVLIDSFGIFWGIVFVRILGWTGRHTIFRPFLKKKKPAGSAGNSPDRGEGNDSRRTDYGSYDRDYGGQYGRNPGVSYGNQAGYSGQTARNPGGGSADGYSQQYGRNHGGGYGNQAGYSGQTGQNPGGSADGYSQQYGQNYSSGYGNQAGYSGQSRTYQGRNGSEYADSVLEDDLNERIDSDRLSEDMSFKKLIHDLREQKNAKKKGK